MSTLRSNSKSVSDQSDLLQVDLEEALELTTRPHGLEQPPSSALVYTVLLPCDTKSLSLRSPPLSTAFACSDTAQSGLLDRSKALSQAFTMPAGTPLHTAIEMAHALHGTEWLYKSSPLCEVLSTLGYAVSAAPALLPALATVALSPSLSGDSSSTDGLCKLLETLETLAPRPRAWDSGSRMALHPILVADLDTDQFEVMGNHWQRDAVPSAGELWVRSVVICC